MVTDKSNSANVVQQSEPEKKKKKGFWGKFATFLMMGGFILVLVVGVAILIAISMLTKSC